MNCAMREILMALIGLQGMTMLAGVKTERGGRQIIFLPCC